VPVEETLLGLAPLGVAGLAAMVSYGWQRTQRLMTAGRSRRAARAR
jgi:hypothetical protein